MTKRRKKFSPGLEERIITEAMLYLSHDDETYKSVAEKMKLSQTTIGRDLYYKLESIDKILYAEVRKKVKYNTRIALFRARAAKLKKKQRMLKMKERKTRQKKDVSENNDAI